MLNKYFLSFFIVLFILDMFPVNASNHDKSTFVDLTPGTLNGAYLIQDPDAKQLQIHVIMNRGERDNPYEEGLAHFLEHLVWKNISPENNNSDASLSNAWTTRRATGYYITDTPDTFEASMMRMAKVFDPIPATYADREKAIVLRELETRTLEDPYFYSSDIHHRTLHGSDPMARSVLGTKGSISNYSYQDAQALHTISHRPEYSSILIFGDISPAAAQQAITANFGNTDQGAVHPVLEYKYQGPSEETHHISLDDINAHSMVIRSVFRMNSAPDLYTRWAQVNAAQTVLLSTRSGGFSGPLRFDDFIARYIELGFDVLDKEHLSFWFRAAPDRSVSLQHLYQNYTQTLALLAETPLDQRSLDPHIKNHDTWLTEISNKPRQNFARIKGYLTGGLIPLTIEQERSYLDRITTQKIDHIIQSLAAANRTMVHFYSPKK